MNLDDYTFQPLYQDGVLATLRGDLTAGHGAILITTAASERDAAEAALYLNNEYALRERLLPAWSRAPQGLAWHNGVMALIYPDAGDTPLSQRAAGPLAPDAFLPLALSICGALRGLHDAGLLHQNIKPANILTDSSGHCRLTGFGVARVGAAHARAAQADVVRGTPAYMSPEQTGRTQLGIDARSDLYSLGVTLYELLTGRLPFMGNASAAAGEWMHAHLASEPAPPHREHAAMPVMLSKVVLKLLAKQPGERYQSAAALEADLRRCQDAWRERGQIAQFPLGQGGAPALRFPARLYSRDDAMAALLAAWQQVASDGKEVLALVHGPSGVGKSALVAQFLRDPQLRTALVASAKVDQFGGAAPYAALSAALRTLVRRILGQSAQEVAFWRQRVQQVLADDAELAIALVPELALLAGDVAHATTPAAPESPSRLTMTVFRLLQLFAVRERPLILMIDDVQWLDAASLQVLEQLLEQASGLPLLLLLTSRAADGDALPPAAAHLRARAQQAVEIALPALTPVALQTMLAEAMSADPMQISELAALVYQKTAGNPYFVQQFVQTAVDEGLVARDAASGEWRFRLSEVGALRYTDNLADIALGRLARLPSPTRRMLGALACMGRSGSTALLRALYELEEREIDSLLTVAVEADVLLADADGYVFTHDRLQEAAYAELDGEARQRLHARLARLMASAALENARDDLLFGAMDHLQKAVHLVPAEERQEMAAIGLMAGRKARRACAYLPALSYLNMARSLLDAGDDSAAERLAFDLALEQASCYFFSGNLDAAAAMVPALRTGPSAPRVQGQVLRLAADIATRRGDYALAVSLILEGLRAFGIGMAAAPSDAECERAYAALRASLQGDWRGLLRGLPQQTDPDTAVVMALLSSLLAPATFTSQSLLFLHLCATLQVSLEHGMSGETAVALAWFGVQVCHRYGHNEDGFEYGMAARALVEQHSYRAYAGFVLLGLDQLSVWTQPLGFALDCAQAGYDAALAVGDLTTAAFEACHRTCMMLTRGDKLDTLSGEIARARAFVGKIEFRDVEGILQVQQNFVDHLRGVSGEGVLQPPAGADSMATLRFWHWLYLAMAAFLENDIAKARASLAEAAQLAWSAPGHLHLMEFHLFSVLSLCAEPVDDDALDAQVAAHLAPLAAWAESNPATFADKYALAQAAIRQRQGDAFGALALYDQAIRHAHAQGHEHCAAVAHELAAALCRQHGHVTGAQAHRLAAIEAYRRWGALRKVAELQGQERAPHAPAQGAGVTAQDTISIVETAEIRNIDSVIRAVRALSEEIQTAPLVRTLMTIALEHAGAQRGLLIRMDGETPLMEASAVLGEHGIQIDLRQAAPGELDLPLTMLHTAMRTLKPVGVAGAPRAAPWDSDAYLLCYPRCSAICIPMLKQARLVGMLYLENRLASAAFTSEQAAVLSLLAAQAAVSLETAGLYAELLDENQQRRQAEKALRESRATLLLGEQINRSGSWTWDLDRAMLNCSPEFCRIFGFDPAQPQVSLAAFIERVHPDDRERVTRALDRGIEHRHALRVDYRLLDADGKVRYLTGAGEPFGVNDNAVYVGTTVDVTARRAAEDSLRQTQAELARVARVTTVGQLTSSIAHEINQPLMSISSNAGASLRWLERDPPQLDRVRAGLQEIAAQSQRAGGIIRGLRALTRKAPQESAPFDLHATIRHIIGISRAELERQNVAVTLALNAASGWVDGDTVQLQQVLLNVVVNALDAMSEVQDRPRSLAITTGTQDGQLAVRVDDSGSGLDEEGAAQMFEAYFTTKQDGMGMGLAICRSIMEAHGGTISAQPRQPHGCSVLFRLPERV
jgi:PAS domain S-box-containing protein